MFKQPKWSEFNHEPSARLELAVKKTKKKDNGRDQEERRDEGFSGTSINNL